MDKINVLVTASFSPALMDRLSNVSPRLSLTQHEVSRFADIAGLIDKVDVLYTWQKEALPLPGTAPRLRWVQLHSAGIDHMIDHPLFTSSEVVFTTANGIHAVQVGEYVLAQMLAFARHLPKMMEDKANMTWPQGRWKRYVPNELYGATLGIIGYGQIGRHVARLAQTFGMHILAIKRNVRQPAADRYHIPGVGDPEGTIPDRFYPPQALRSFLSVCDYVVITVPLTPETHHLVDSHALQAMRPHAILINVSRGPVVDENALVAVLEKGAIGGAALDVFEQEPLPPDSPLWKLPNVILSPHVSGFSPRYDERAVELFAENLRRFVAGEPLLNVVDRARGY